MGGMGMGLGMELCCDIGLCRCDYYCVTMFQLAREQQDEELLLKKERDEAIAKLKADIDREREETERELRESLETSMSDLRKQLEKEREKERDRVRAECVGGVTRCRQQLMEETDKVGVALGHMTNKNNNVQYSGAPTLLGPCTCNCPDLRGVLI